MRVADLLRKKGSSVVTLPPGASVTELLTALEDHRIGAVVVVEDDRVVGMVAERDVVHHLRAGGDLSAPLESLLTEVETCDPTTDLVDLARSMTERRQRHVPVVRDGTLLGIVSIGDVVKARLDALEAERDALESYLRQ